jgi:hypothetical protein
MERRETKSEKIESLKNEIRKISQRIEDDWHDSCPKNDPRYKFRSGDSPADYLIPHLVSLRKDLRKLEES